MFKKMIPALLLIGALVLAACGPAPVNEIAPEDPLAPSDDPGIDPLTPTDEGMPVETPIDGDLPETGDVDPGRVSILLDAVVLTADGTQIGPVDDILIDPLAGSIQYVVVASNGTLVPIPFELVEWDELESAWVLGVEAEAVDTAPSFSEYPDTQQPDWDAEFRSYWAAY